MLWGVVLDALNTIGTMFGICKGKSGYVSCVVFYLADLCYFLPPVHHQDNGRRYFGDEQKSFETDTVLGKG